MSLPDITTLATFVAVVDHGGFSRAAERLDTTAGAVSRRIAALERHLGLRLINRTTRQLNLTEAGEHYYRDVSAILQALSEAEDRVSHLSEAPSGELRVAAPLSFGVRALAPLLPDFHARYPALHLLLDLDDRMVDIVAAGADLALRIGPLTDSSLVARRIARFERVFCAAPAYLDRRGRPRTPAELRDHACLRYSNLGVREEWTLHRREDPGTTQTLEVTGPLCANNGDLLRHAAIAGMGICTLPRFIVAEDLDSGALECVLGDWRAPPLMLSAVWPSRRFVPAKVRVFVDYLVAHLGDAGESAARGGDA
ncbi:LysR family transcriptional regulator [uncultured Thiohalocapsa sp.]|uniref:LysR family transcriptional regulator n=1 Tax=uncultured Thiohalocapsa sp. TaxID=768990 RepID=UPI0025FB3A87|nr:LysR family transcriptional regulator [uncultured Thiohalocapsa sp.]